LKSKKRITKNKPKLSQMAKGKHPLVTKNMLMQVRKRKALLAQSLNIQLYLGVGLSNLGR